MEKLLIMNGKNVFKGIFGTEKPIIGMVHLKPLPGSPGYDPDKGMKFIIKNALEDADRLVNGGIDGIQVENQFDKPFLKAEEIGWETVAAITSVVTNLKAKYGIPMGVNIHLNGVCQALAVAAATECKWIRAFELANAYISNSGIIEAAGPKALRYRSVPHANDIMIFGDFHVKHGSHQITADRSLEEQAEDVEAAKADGVIVTGVKTGSPPTSEDIKRIKGSITIPILIGSGLTIENISEFLPLIDGAIVGSYFKNEGKLSNSIDVLRVKKFMYKVRSLRK